MTTSEPEDGSYVAVAVRSGVQVLHRDDQLAADLQLSDPRVWHWFVVTSAGVSPINPASWLEVCGHGPLAYVGAFVERLAEAPSAHAPWQTLNRAGTSPDRKEA